MNKSASTYSQEIYYFKGSNFYSYFLQFAINAFNGLKVLVIGDLNTIYSFHEGIDRHFKISMCVSIGWMYSCSALGDIQILQIDRISIQAPAAVSWCHALSALHLYWRLSTGDLTCPLPLHTGQQTIIYNRYFVVLNDYFSWIM